MRGKTITAVFRGQREARTASLYQYDYGQVLTISDLILPVTYEVHFGSSVSGPTVTMLGGPDGVAIPDILLTKPGKIYAWIYLHDGSSDGETEYLISIPVNERGSITDAEPTPVQQDIISQTIAALDAGVSEVEGIAAAIPGTVNDALAAAKASGEFDGPPGEPGPAGADGQPGPAGRDGVSPSASVTQIEGGAVLTVMDGSGTTTATLYNGADGQPGQDGSPGADGYSPTASVSKSGSTATITITDKNDTTTATVIDGQNGQDGQPGPGVASGGTQGQMLVKKSATDYDTEWANQPSVPVTDVQVNGTSVLSNGVANVPVATGSVLGVVKVWTGDGLRMKNGSVLVDGAGADLIKAGTEQYRPLVPNGQHIAAFYGLAKAAGDSTQASSSNSAGTYTETARSKISEMLNAPVSVSGSTPTITAKAGVQYICGEVATLSFTPSASGVCDVVFESGSTATVLTVPSTVKWPDWFDPTALEANATYELNVLNGTLGAVGVWT